MTEDWVKNLKEIVQKEPLIAFQFDGEEWARLQDSRRGVNEFTFARAHGLLKKVKTPTACLIFGQNDGEESAYFGLVSSHSPVTPAPSHRGRPRTVALRRIVEAIFYMLVTGLAAPT